MISSISVGNFKAFADMQTLPIKPITLIFGANSSGKSSIIHSLLLAHEVLHQDKLDLDIHFTKIGGESVDLGGFRQYVNRGVSTNNVLLGIEINCDQFPRRLKEIFYSVKKLKFLIEFGDTNVDFFSGLFEPKVKNIEILTDENSLLKMSLKGNIKGNKWLQMDVINIENNIIKTFFEALILSYTTSERISDEDQLSFTNALNFLVPKLIADTSKIFPEGLKGLEEFTDLRINVSTPTMQPVNKENRDEVIKKITTNVLPFILDEMFVELSKYISSEIYKLTYLGPLRSYPERHFNFRKSNDSNWFAGGGHAWEIVVKNEIVRKKVNEWLGSDKLKQKYELRITELIPDYLLKNKLPDNLSDIANKVVASLILDMGEREEDPTIAFSNILLEAEDIDPMNACEDVINTPSFEYLNIDDYGFDSASKEIISKLVNSRMEKLTDLILFDKNSNTQVSHRDVGIGISQVLPVLVSAFANKEKLIAIEQPEIHLHPALQAELGDLFINSALGENKNSFILETHSEHLILRIMKRVRQTTEGNLPDGLSQIKPEDVQIVFVEPFEGRSIIREMPINDMGELIKGWPGGFFDERLEELF